jgi:predicted DNA-binding protein (UPF0251 family)
MGRRPLWRRVDLVPQVTYFKPAGVPLSHLQEVRLFIEEAEAVRLKDIEGLEQDECARRMNISRPTFHRVLGAARSKLADALLNGKAIRIEGGSYEMTKRRFRCGNGHEWEVPFEVMIDTPPYVCPTCNTADIVTLWPWKHSWGKASRGPRYRS